MPTGHGSLVTRAQFALGLSQAGLGDLLGVNKRTIGRWEGEQTMVTRPELGRIAALVHGKDRGLAAELAKAAGKTFVELGLEPAPAPPSPRPTPTSMHLVDSIVCAAAEAVDSTPKAVRPILAAAFQRASAVGLDVGQVVEALQAPEGPPVPGGKKKPPGA